MNPQRTSVMLATQESRGKVDEKSLTRFLHMKQTPDPVNSYPRHTQTSKPLADKFLNRTKNTTFGQFVYNSNMFKSLT